MEQVCGQQQLGLIPNALKEKRHGLVQGVALGLEEQPVEFFVFAAVKLQFHGLLPAKARQIDIGSVLQDFGVWPALGMTQNAVAVVQIAVQLHVTYGCETVEPRVGYRLHDLLEAVAPDPFFQTLARFCYIAGEGVCPDHGHIARFYNRLNVFGSQAIKRCPAGDRRDEVAPCFLGIGFEYIAIHIVIGAGLTDFYALVFGQGIGQFFTKIVKESVHVVLRFKIGRLDELARRDDPPGLDYRLVLHRLAFLGFPL